MCGCFVDAHRVQADGAHPLLMRASGVSALAACAACRRSYVLFNHLEEALRVGQVSASSVPEISHTFSKVQGVFAACVVCFLFISPFFLQGTCVYMCVLAPPRHVFGARAVGVFL